MSSSDLQGPSNAQQRSTNSNNNHNERNKTTSFSSSSSATIAPNSTTTTVTPNNRQHNTASTLHQQYLNYFNSNIPKGEIKSQQQMRDQTKTNQSTQIISNHEQSHQMQRTNATFSNQKVNQTGRSHSNPAQIYQIPSSSSFRPQLHSNNNSQFLSKSVPKEDPPSSHRLQQAQHYPSQRICSASAISSSTFPLHQIDEAGRNGTNIPSRKEQQTDRDSEEVVATTMRAEMEDVMVYKEAGVEALNSLERNLPIELSFLIRQQAFCMARMNYLDRQIRELRESNHHRHQADSTTPQVSSTSIMNHHHHQHHNQSQYHHQKAHQMMMSNAAIAHTKNGDLILSDDSGGEYSRATISDDDELSSLLDQIAKSIRPEQRSSLANGLGNNMSISHQKRSVANYSAIISNQPQQYAIINPNQPYPHHHQQTVPIFVMGSPIAVAHPSSISSNVLPGVHFQPEPRYNQFYEDFYCQPPTNMATNSGSTMVHSMRQKASSGHRSQQFDSSITAIEQLVSQKEKRQIQSQLRSADNWLKMRSSSLAYKHNDSSFNNAGNLIGGNDNSCSTNNGVMPAAAASSSSSSSNMNGVREAASDNGSDGRVNLTTNSAEIGTFDEGNPTNRKGS